MKVKLNGIVLKNSKRKSDKKIEKYWNKYLNKRCRILRIKKIVNFSLLQIICDDIF